MQENVLTLPRESALTDYLTIAQAAALSIPLALPAVFGYDTNPAFLLAPIIIWAAIAKRDALLLTFLLAGVGGLASIFIAAKLYPDGRVFKDVLSLVLIMFTASFYFLGRQSQDLRRFVAWAAIFSAVFVIPVAIRLMILGQPARIAIDNYLYYNAVWLGLPTFASFGVNSAVHLTCVQAALFIGVIFASENRWLTALSAAGLACAAFLIVGSESRSSMVALIAIFGGALFYAIQHRNLWQRSILIAVVILIGVFGGIGNSPNGDRLAKLLEDAGTVVDNIPGEQPQPSLSSPGAGHNDQSVMAKLNAMSTGRLKIALLAVKEFLSSPIVGTGFSPFGRYEPVPEGSRLASGSHIYYLTIPWKGGVLFALPFFGFLILAAWRVVRARPWGASPEAAMAVTAVLTIFGLVALTYDTPSVPAVGALTFFLMGALGKAPSPMERGGQPHAG